MYRITQRLRLQSRFMIKLLPSHDGNRQAIWWRRRRRSNEFSKGGDNHLYTIKSNQQLKAHREAIYQDTYPEVDQSRPTDKLTRPPGGNLPTHAPRSQPTWLRFYWSRISRAQPGRWPDDHLSGPRTTITKSSSIYQSMPLTDDYWRREIFQGAQHEGSGERKFTWTW